MRILWISQHFPYDGVAHAGGRIHNYLLKYFHKQLGGCYLISFANEEEYNKIDLNKYNIPYDITRVSIKKDFFYFGKKLFNILFVFLYFLGLGTAWYIWRIFKASLKYKQEYNEPDVVILQWTSVVNQIWWLKKLFPKSKFVVIEEDVTYLKKERIISKSSFSMKFFRIPVFAIFKKIELNSLNLSDLVVLNNEKDRDLILKEEININKTFVCHPFFQNMLQITNKHIGKDILFYGAMNRPENYQSAIWFIQNVFSELEPLGFRFVVVGNKPHESLKKFDNGKSICITGFVENVNPYFENSLCLVAPLLLGAGVKIKVIEAMSSGLPVLTNEIGIEGIPAKDGKEFFLCKSVLDYRRRILELSNDFDIGNKMGNSAKELIARNFNYQTDAEVLFQKTTALVKR